MKSTKNKLSIDHCNFFRSHSKKLLLISINAQSVNYFLHLGFSTIVKSLRHVERNVERSSIQVITVAVLNFVFCQFQNTRQVYS